MREAEAVQTFGTLIDKGYLFVSDGYRAKNEELGGEGAIFLRAAHVTDAGIDLEGVERFHVDLLGKVRSKLSATGDVIVTTKGNSTGRVAFVTPDLPQFVYSPHLSFWRSLDPDAVTPGFLRYWSMGREFRDQLSGLKSSTDMAPYLSLVDQRRLRITLPPPAEQRSIAQVLGALDDKIDLNRRMNETLEAIARAVFKSWFVDFDPVRAKAEGRELAGMDADTAALFPDSLEESAFGKIPRGWTSCAWGNLVTLEYGKSLNSWSLTGGSFPVFGTNGPIGTHTEPLCRHAGVIIGRKGAYRGVHYSPIPFFVIDTAFYLEPRVDLELRWAYYALRREDINGLDSGSAIPSTSRADFYALPVVAPPYPVQQRFVEMLGRVWSKQETNKAESATLSGLRDALLPKLLSGEVRASGCQAR